MKVLNELLESISNRTEKMFFEPCYENNTPSQELKLDNKCFLQS